MRRMTRTSAGLVTAMEADAATAEAKKDDVAPDRELEQANDEVKDSAAEGEAAEDQKDEAEDTVEALESIYDALGVAAQNGGIDKYAAGALGIALNHMYARVGITATSMPALESFGGTSTRIGATQIAMEDIKDQVAKIWRAIVEALKKAAEWVKTFFNKVFDGATKLKARAQSLEEKAQASHGKPKEAKFESSSLVSALFVGPSVPDNLATSIGDLNAVAKAVFGNVETQLKFGEQFATTAGVEGSQKTFLTSAELKEQPIAGSTKVPNPGDEGFTDPKEGFVVSRTKQLFGGKAVVSYTPATTLKGQAAIDAVAALRYDVTNFSSKVTTPKDANVKTLSGSECVEVSKAVGGIADELLAYKANQAKVSEMLAKVADAAEKAGKSAEKAEGEDKAGFEAIRKFAQRMPTMLAQPATGLAKYMLPTGKALLDYVEQSLKQSA